MSQPSILLFLGIAACLDMIDFWAQSYEVQEARERNVRVDAIGSSRQIVGPAGGEGLMELEVV